MPVQYWIVNVLDALLALQGLVSINSLIFFIFATYINLIHERLDVLQALPRFFLIAVLPGQRFLTQLLNLISLPNCFNLILGRGYPARLVPSILCYPPPFVRRV